MKFLTWKIVLLEMPYFEATLFRMVVLEMGAAFFSEAVHGICHFLRNEKKKFIAKGERLYCLLL